MTLGSNVPSGQSEQLMSEVAPELRLLGLDMLEVWRSGGLLSSACITLYAHVTYLVRGHRLRANPKT